MKHRLSDYQIIEKAFAIACSRLEEMDYMLNDVDAYYYSADKWRRVLIKIANEILENEQKMES